MPKDDRVPRFPEIRLEILDDLSPDTGSGFLRLVRRRLRAQYPDGTASEPFVYDEIDRRAYDAVVIAAHYLGPGGRRVFLRSAIRPPVYFRRAGVERSDRPRQLWELPAGLIEPEEEAPDGLPRAALRELHEETGLRPNPSRLSPLGPTLYPCPGVIGERLFFFEIEVDPGSQVDPPLDGSALERFGAVVDLPLDRAVDHCRTGVIEDVKTEIGLRRLAERYP